jgi:hypothetical protein
VDVIKLLEKEKSILVKKMDAIIQKKEFFVSEFCSNHNQENEVVDLYEEELKISLEIKKIEKAMKEVIKIFVVEKMGEIMTCVVFKELFLARYQKELIFISEKSPMGRALVNSTDGEVIEYQCPRGIQKLKIIKSY